MNQPQSVGPQHPKKLLWLYILIAILLLTSGFFGWSYFSNNTAQSAVAVTGSKEPAQTDKTASPTIDCEKYISQDYGFSINYPKSYTYEEKTPAGGALGEVIFTNQGLGESYKVTVTVANKSSVVEPAGMEPVSTKEITIAGLSGKNFDDLAYVVDNDQYRFRVTVDGGADQTLKIMAKFIANSFQFSS